MERSTTIKDIAARSGYSFSTVHLVLAGKPGPKEETRREILELARDMNDRRNLAVSSMKRSTIKIAVILPAPTM